MTNRTALMAAICADPADDTPRLAYADWLEENAGTVKCKECGGSGWEAGREGTERCNECLGNEGPPDGRAARAEFIRTQVALARLPPEHRRLGFGSQGACVVRSAGPDYWRTFELHDPDIKVGDRVDVRVFPLKSKSGVSRKDSEKTLHGLVVTNIDDSDEYGTEYTVKRDADSGPWPGRKLKKRLLELWPTCTALPPEFDGQFNWSRGFLRKVETSPESWERMADALYWHPSQGRECPETAHPLELVELTSVPRTYMPQSKWPNLDLRIKSYLQTSGYPYVLNRGQLVGFDSSGRAVPVFGDSPGLVIGRVVDVAPNGEEDS